MNSRFINLLGVAALTVSLASCSAASEDLSSSSVKTEQKAAVTAETDENNEGKMLARFVAENEIAQRLEEETTLWTADSKVTSLYPVYMAGVDGVAYYECKVETNGKDAGYVLVSVTQNDILIPETAECGKTLSEQYANALGNEDFNILRYDYFTSAAESSTISRSTNAGTLLATKGFFDGDILIEETSRGGSNSDWYYECRKGFEEHVVENGAIPQYSKKDMEVFYKDMNFSVTRGGKKVELPYIKGGTHYELKNTFNHGYSTPRWAQYDLGDGYPAGCGSTAWAILYAYWHQFKGKNKLFIDEEGLSIDLNQKEDVTVTNKKNGEKKTFKDPYCNYYAGSLKKEIIQVMDVISDYCDGKICYDIKGNKARMILPYTNPGMNNGIDYAKKLQLKDSKGNLYKPYSGSVKCKTLWADWQGATDNIINEIRNDRPVILYFDGKNFKGEYFKYHYAVVTGVMEHYWTNSDLTTQLRLDVNNGWGMNSDNYKQIYAFTHDWSVRTTNCFDYYMVSIY